MSARNWYNLYPFILLDIHIHIKVIKHYIYQNCELRGVGTSIMASICQTPLYITRLKAILVRGIITEYLVMLLLPLSRHYSHTARLQTFAQITIWYTIPIIIHRECSLVILVSICWRLIYPSPLYVHFEDMFYLPLFLVWDITTSAVIIFIYYTFWNMFCRPSFLIRGILNHPNSNHFSKSLKNKLSI